MKINLNQAEKAIDPETQVRVKLAAEVTVPVSYLIGEDEEQHVFTNEEELVEIIQRDHVYSSDPTINLVSILADCGLFDKSAIKEIDIKILPET